MHPPRFTPIVFLLAILVPALAWAGGRKVWNLGLEPPAEIVATPGEAQKAFAEVAAERIRLRLEAAGIKTFSVTVSSPSTLRLETGIDRDEAWMEALLTSPGRLEIRPLVPEPPRWVDLASTLPAGVEIRGEEEPWLWSPSRKTLEGWLARVSLPKVVVQTYPEDGGHRTVALGETLVSERDLRQVSIQKTAAGAPYVEVTVSGTASTRLAALPASGVEQCAIVLDGEVIGFLRTSALRADNRLRISVPRGALPDSRKLRQAWIQQVAGRLAAPFPVPIAVLKE